MGQLLIDGVNDVLNRYGLIDIIKAVPYRWPCMPYIWFLGTSKKAQELKKEFYYKLCQRGILLLANHMNFVCLARLLNLSEIVPALFSTSAPFSKALKGTCIGDKSWMKVA